MSVFQSVNPATGKTLHTAPAWTHTELTTVLDHQAAQWPALATAPVSRRLVWLESLKQQLSSAKTVLARTITREMGKPIRQSEAEVDKTLALIDYLLGHADSALHPRSLASDVQQAYAPLGGILGIMPWNYPIWQVCRFALPALVAGNTVAVKPAPNVLLSTRMLERLVADAGFPDQSLRVLQSDVDQLDHAYDHPHIRQVHFTGSSHAGRDIAAACGQRLKPTTLELGGNDAWLLTDSGDLSQFVKTALASRMNNSGQSCLCAKRWLIPHGRLDAVLDELDTYLKTYTPALPEQTETTLGPLARSDIQARLLTQWQRLKAGAKVRSEDPSLEGLYTGPAWAVTDEPLNSPVWPDEIFGPVLQLAAYRNLDEAVSWANHSRYGLGGSVWDADPAHAREIALKLNTRNIGINRPMRSRIDVAFGGMGDSGWGLELGVDGLRGLARGQVQYL